MVEEEMAAEEVVEQAAGGIGRKLLLGGIAVALLLAGGIGGVVFTNLGSTDEVEVEKPVVVSNKPALYTSLHPPLVVNFDDKHGATHFMQVTMDVMSRDQNVINAVREHTPVIRNSLILLYGNSVYEEVITRTGKERMLADGLAEIQKIMMQQIGVSGVEAVYFTSLIIQ